MKTLNFYTRCCLFLLLIGHHSNAQTNQGQVKAVIENYFKAIGGKEKAAQIKSFYADASASLKGKNIKLTNKMMLPNKFLTRMYFDGKLVSESIFNGKNGVMQTTNTSEKFSEDELKRHRKNRSIFPEFDYLETATYAGIEKVNNQDCHVLKIANSKVYYNVTTGLKDKGSSIQHKNGEAFLQHIYFSKYVNIEGLLFPSNTSMQVGTHKLIFQTQTMYLNREVSASDFELN